MSRCVQVRETKGNGIPGREGDMGTLTKAWTHKTAGSPQRSGWSEG